jgi:Flp pilus assembly protein TadD
MVRGNFSSHPEHRTYDLDEAFCFVAHSFSEQDKDVVWGFLNYFNRVVELNVGFSWVHAENAEPKELSEKVLRLTEGRNLLIAICTKHERVIQPSELKPGFFRSNMSYAQTSAIDWKASDWLLQEIGLAVGRGMQLIILLEKDVRRPKGLQGDLEYISFDRAEPSKAFQKFLEMLNALSTKETGMEQVSTDAVAEPTSGGAGARSAGPSAQQPSPTGAEKRDYRLELFEAIQGDDSQAEQRIIREYSESEEGRKADRSAEFEGLAIDFRRMLQKSVDLHKLERLSSQHPDSSELHHILGGAYDQYEQFRTAAQQYEEAARVATHEAQKLARLCDAAVARAKAKLEPAERWLIQEARELSKTVAGGEATLVSALGQLAEVREDDDCYCAYAELFLEFYPDDNYRRASLAYKYLQLTDNTLAVFHSELIPRKERTEGLLNNLGVAYARSGLKGHAVASYRKSEGLGGTLAMSNLAHILVSAGFLTEAQELCNKATKVNNYDKAIGTAITQIREAEDTEKKEKTKAIAEKQSKRHFLSDYARARLGPMPADQEGTWTGPECPLTVRLKSQKFTATGSYETQEVGSLPLLLGGSTQTQAKTAMAVTYDGEASGLTVKFRKTVSRASSGGSALTDPAPKEGLIIISEGGDSLRVYEKTTGGAGTFHQLLRATAAG